jgi:hypothetical protein
MKLGIEYLAGLMDGEGCIHIALQNKAGRSPSYSVRVVFAMTHEPIIKMIAEQYSVSYCCFNLTRKNLNWRRAYQLQICGERATGLLKDMLPFLVVKREEAELSIKLQDHITRHRNTWKRISQEDKDALIAYREGIRLQIKALKHLDASIGMMANSGEPPCPVRNDAEGQSRAKQRLTIV